MHTIVYLTHLSCVTISISWFLLRAGWMIAESPVLNNKINRVGPHIIDTLLLLSALTLAVQLNQYPFQAGWLTVKLLALVVYIVSGAYALKRGKTLRIRLAFLTVSIVSICYIVSVALTKNPLVMF